MALTLLLFGCTVSEYEQAQDLASNHGFTPQVFSARQYEILGFIKKQPHSKTVHVYIEGDGLAWLSRSVISPDPTPSEPLGLHIACADQSPHTVIYLARPCQYIKSQTSHPQDWTSGRFSKKITRAYLKIIDQLKKEYSEIHLFGYSGGATIALLIAAHRPKTIKSVTTFAGLLNPDGWVRIHNYSLLKGSLTPLTFTDKLRTIPQRHFMGEEDTEIPPFLADAYRVFIRNDKHVKFVVVPELNHHADWAGFWAQQQKQ